jgi:hypothetical protein
MRDRGDHEERVRLCLDLSLLLAVAGMPPGINALGVPWYVASGYVCGILSYVKILPQTPHQHACRICYLRLNGFRQS